MRDPQRIPDIINRLLNIWTQHPDMRLAQIIACGAEGDPFYVEDEPLMERIEGILSRG